MKRIREKTASILLAGLMVLTGCGMTPAPLAGAPDLSLASVEAPDMLTRAPEFEAARRTLSEAGVRLDLRKVLKLHRSGQDAYVLSTDQADLRVIALVRDDRVLTVSLVRTADTTTVTDLSTQAVTVVRQDGRAALAFGYAAFSGSRDSLLRIASSTPPERKIPITAQAGTRQCTGSVPANLLQAREQAQDDAAHHQEQLAVAIAAVAATSATVLAACGLTTLTGGVSSPACIGAVGLYAGALQNAQEKTRQRDDANIRKKYAQLAIDQWKSSHASSHDCHW